MINEQPIGNLMTYAQHQTNALFHVFFNNPLKANDPALSQMALQWAEVK